MAIVLKSQALAVKVKPFIEAARVAGGSTIRVIVVHVVPNVMPLSLLYMMFTVTGAIQTEAILSFLGLLNIDMSWGLMIELARNQGYILTGMRFWWLVFPAGLCVSLLAAAFFPGRPGDGRGDQPPAEEAMMAWPAEPGGRRR